VVEIIAFLVLDQNWTFFKGLTYWYAAMTKDEAQHSRMTFYEAVNLELTKTGNISLPH
jgi:hypothetical protein